MRMLMRMLMIWTWRGRAPRLMIFFRPGV